MKKVFSATSKKFAYPLKTVSDERFNGQDGSPYFFIRILYTLIYLLRF